MDLLNALFLSIVGVVLVNKYQSVFGGWWNAWLVLMFIFLIVVRLSRPYG